MIAIAMTPEQRVTDFLATGLTVLRQGFGPQARFFLGGRLVVKFIDPATGDKFEVSLFRRVLRVRKNRKLLARSAPLIDNQPPEIDPEFKRPFWI